MKAPCQPKMAEQESNPNEKLLTEIRENFSYAEDAWKEIRDEAKKDMRYVSGDPWDETERSRREDPKSPRPCLTFDELNQYTNQLINDVRDQKRAIQVTPKGTGANDKTANLRANRIRQIEYESNAQAAYITAFENAVNRSYGAFRVNTAYVDDDSLDQTLRIRRIANPDTVWPDPDFKEADASDINWCFVTDLIDKTKFEREYPNAEIKSFTPEMSAAYPQWIRDKKIQIAEYWKREGSDSELAIEGKKRKVRKFKVTQYITNGVEILDKNEWLGKFIPIIFVFGKELWIDNGGGAKRVLESLIRKSRDPYMAYCWARSSEAELIRMTPKTPFIGYTGQFEGKEEFWQSVNDTPRAYLEVNASVQDAQGQVLPLPQRQPYAPAIDQLEIFTEACRRGIQSAMGIIPLPTPAQRQNEKSGVALQRIQVQTQKGSFHFVDNFERSIKHAGRVMDDLLDKIHDTERDIAVRDEKGKTSVLHVKPEDFGEGSHDVTISTGPSYESEREQANEFVDNLLQTIPALPIPDPVKAQIIALSLKMKDLGPIVDDMAKLISPQGEADISPQAMAQIQQAQGQVQQLHAYAQQLEGELKKLSMEKQAKVVDNEFRLTIEKMKIEASVAVAEINTKSQRLNERLTFVEDMIKQLHAQSHEAAMQGAQQGHEQDMAAQGMAQQAEQEPSFEENATVGAQPAGGE